jgi:hypothetical protein
VCRGGEPGPDGRGPRPRARPLCRPLGLSLALLACLAATSCARDVDPAGPPGTAELEDAAWDDGMAVVQVYRGRVRCYGVWRDAEVRDYMVREYIDPDDLTKRDTPGPHLVPVLKVNRTLEFATGTYDYRFLSSFHFRRDTGALLKGTGTCLNACGAVFQRWDAGSERLLSDSYWEGEGRREADLAAAPGWRFADELPFVVRSLSDGAEVRVLPPLASPRSGLQPAGTEAWVGVGDLCVECLLPSPGAARLNGAAAAGPRSVPSRSLSVRQAGTRTRLLGPDGATEAEWDYDQGGFLEAWTLPGEQEFRRVRWFRGPYWERARPEDRGLVEPR